MYSVTILGVRLPIHVRALAEKTACIALIQVNSAKTPIYPPIVIYMMGDITKEKVENFHY